LKKIKTLSLLLLIFWLPKGKAFKHFFSFYREIIHFLIRKLEIEEKQRLKTEEQASKMMTQMEKTIKQMVKDNSNFVIILKDERGSVSRKKESPSTTELNKSIISQN